MLVKIRKAAGVISEREIFWRVEYYDDSDKKWHYWSEHYFKFIARIIGRMISGIESPEKLWQSYRDRQSGKVLYKNKRIIKNIEDKNVN